MGVGSRQRTGIVERDQGGGSGEGGWGCGGGGGVVVKVWGGGEPQEGETGENRERRRQGDRERVAGRVGRGRRQAVSSEKGSCQTSPSQVSCPVSPVLPGVPVPSLTPARQPRMPCHVFKIKCYMLVHKMYKASINTYVSKGKVLPATYNTQCFAFCLFIVVCGSNACMHNTHTQYTK